MEALNLANAALSSQDVSAATHFSLVIPVYKNLASLAPLLSAVQGLAAQLKGVLEVVFVVDGSPDASAEWLQTHLPESGVRAQLLLHSRNFGSFAAIRTGLAAARGPYFAVMAADLQEPPELVLKFFHALQLEEIDVVIGTRDSRQDPILSQWASTAFWRIYRRFVQPEMPVGGVDIFGCNTVFRDQLLTLREHNSSLVGLIFWLGFKRKLIGYERRARAHQYGRSAWTLQKKIKYLLDSVFAFSDLPLKILMFTGGFGMAVAFFIAVVAFYGRITGQIIVPGYTMLIIAITFFGALNIFALGVVGSYVWRAFENTKRRPLSIVAKHYVAALKERLAENASDS